MIASLPDGTSWGTYSRIRANIGGQRIQLVTPEQMLGRGLLNQPDVAFARVGWGTRAVAGSAMAV